MVSVCVIARARAHTHTHTSFDISSKLPVRLPVGTFVFVLHLNPSISKPPLQSTSPQVSYLWYLMEFILFSSSHLCFPLLIQISPPFYPKINYTISYKYVLTRTCVRCWWCTWLILSLQCTCTQVTPHLKPHCSSRKRMAVSAYCCTLSQTVHGTRNTLWVCIAIEGNMEQ